MGEVFFENEEIFSTAQKDCAVALHLWRTVRVRIICHQGLPFTDTLIFQCQNMEEAFTQLLPEMLREGYVCVQRHPTVPLYIYNYTSKAQYERVWNEVTLQCRGLILDANGRVVARPFRKFFNLEEVQDLPAGPFEVYEKLDGSLGILYWLGDEAYLATRGSFASEQSRRANGILQARYRHVLPRLDRGHTYLFEIIYPENRIVVNYGGREDLVLLAVVDTATGAELPLPEVGFPVVERYDGLTDLATIRRRRPTTRRGSSSNLRAATG
jgi:RNA ligase